MRREQEIALWAGLIVIQLMIIFPPVVPIEATSVGVDVQNNNFISTTWAPCYGIIVRDYKNIRVGVLAIQIVFVAAVTGVLIYTLREKEPKPQQQ